MNTSNSGNDPSWRTELEALCERAIEGQLDEAARDRIEQVVASDPAARRFYADYMHQHAALAWSAAKPEMMGTSDSTSAGASSASSGMRLPIGGSGGEGAAPAAARTENGASLRAPQPTRLTRWVKIGAFGLSAAAVLLLGLFIGNRLLPGRETAERGATPALSQPQPAVATLTSTKAAKWSGGTLPTADGARLTAGKLHLAEGVARLTFDSGAEVSLEGPAELELLSKDKCVLASGRLVASVPERAFGFVVETQAAILTDLGTEFGVSVRGPDSVDVAVFDGLVDVRERATGQMKRIGKGNTARVVAQQVTVYPSSSELPPPSPAANDAVASGAADTSRRMVQISDALGRGKDAYVLSSGPPDHEHTQPGMIQVKNVLQSDSLYQRKAYVTFDLAPIVAETILEARLDLTLIPTAFSSRFPDATFAVYGVTDESLDDWDEKTMDWDSAPANGPGGAGVDSSKAVLLGKFVVEQGIQQGTFGVEGDALKRFLQRDRNGLATMIIVRETARAEEKSIIHGFASRRHASASPPTLKLVLRAS